MSNISNITLNKKELKAIADLKKLASRWPKSLWLFCNGQNDISVMKMGLDGKQVMMHARKNVEGFDHDYMVDSIEGILTEGGDW